MLLDERPGEGLDERRALGAAIAPASCDRLLAQPLANRAAWRVSSIDGGLAEQSNTRYSTPSPGIDRAAPGRRPQGPADDGPAPAREQRPVEIEERCLPAHGQRTYPTLQFGCQ